MFRLAGHLGKTVQEIRETMSAGELMHWVAFDQLDPIGRERFDVLAGVVASTMANTWKGKDDPPAQPLDMVPDWGGLRAAIEARQPRKVATKEDWQEYAEAVQRLEEG